MFQIVSVILDAAKRDAAESVDFEYELLAGGVCDHVDVGFFANADAVACAVKSFVFKVGVKSEVVEAAVGETVTIVCEDIVRM